jgi:hypothetical protein
LAVKHIHLELTLFDFGGVGLATMKRMSTNPESPWHRVFGLETFPPDLVLIQGILTVNCPDLRGLFRYDEAGWIECRFHPGAWTLSRYTRSDDDIRGELQSWAAWLELQEHSPHRQRLMEHLALTQQVFVFQPPAKLPADAAVALCQALALASDGVYQIDGFGFFATDSSPLLGET